MSIEFLDEIVRSQKLGQARGLASVCSSHLFVLKVAMQRAVGFDRQITVSAPDLTGRLQILRIHTKSIKLSPDFDLDRTARITPGFSVRHAPFFARFRIKTFFSDQKNRGFHLHKSHLSDPSRLARLMQAAGLAYPWIVYIGLWSFRQNLHLVVHRTDRCDLSLFQLGLRVLEYLLDFNLPLPVSFTDFSHAYLQFVR